MCGQLDPPLMIWTHIYCRGSWHIEVHLGSRDIKFRVMGVQKGWVCVVSALNLQVWHRVNLQVYLHMYACSPPTCIETGCFWRHCLSCHHKRHRTAGPLRKLQIQPVLCCPQTSQKPRWSTNLDIIQMQALGSSYHIARNVCGNYSLRFVVKSEVCRLMFAVYWTQSFIQICAKHFSRWNVCEFMPK